MPPVPLLLQVLRLQGVPEDAPGSGPLPVVPGPPGRGGAVPNLLPAPQHRGCQSGAQERHQAVKLFKKNREKEKKKQNSKKRRIKSKKILNFKREGGRREKENFRVMRFVGDCNAKPWIQL